MYKLIVLFKQPPDVVRFEDDWAQKFMPYAEKMPGVVKVQVNTIVGGPEGPANFYKIHEFYFESLDALYAGLESEMGVRAGKGLMAFAADLATVMFADVLEDVSPPPHLAYTPED